jgi:hypothetical protein
MSELKRDTEVKEDTSADMHQGSIWKEDYWLVKFFRKLSPLGFLLRILFWPFVIFVVYGALNYSGFCFRELRYLSDDEKIQKVIAEVSKGRFYAGAIINLATGKVGTIREPIPYESVEVFLKENPDCCTLIPKNGNYADIAPPPTLWQRIFGNVNYGVRMKFKLKYLETPVDRHGNKGIGHERETHIDGIFSSGNCGQGCAGYCDD